MPDPTKTIEQELSRAVDSIRLSTAVEPRGVVRRVGDGVASVSGLPDVRFEELLAFDSGAQGIAFDLRRDTIGVILLAGASEVHEGDGVVGLQRLPDLPVGREALGRVLDPLGNPLDEGPPLAGAQRLPLFRQAPEIIERRSVDRPLLTGVMAVDAAIPIGRGQRELIIGDRNVGKTALAMDFIAAQTSGDVSNVYVMIGQPMSRVRALRDSLERVGALSNTVVIAAYASDSPGMQYLAPLAGASMAESFRDQGQHAIVVYDDLTKHADAYRELALLLDRPPGREAYPGDIFYVHAELLERAAAISDDLGAGSVTAFPLVETTDGDISAYIPTNLISITDGQIYLDTGRFERDLRPAIDIGRSVSRIGAVAQPPPMRAAAKNLKIQISRFESLEKLSRVGLDIDLSTRKSLDEGKILRGLLRQGRFASRSLAHQVIWLTAAAENWLEGLDPEQATAVAQRLMELARSQAGDVVAALNAGTDPEGDWKTTLADLAGQARSLVEGSPPKPAESDASEAPAKEQPE
ncbi:F0F1 ATP synthase subunit alpha [Roseiconus nitratireducens]|uniref:ATP synthase subunit alpha n=1 Tax=Roseiconus nitratireducens TaxID=2605748 RepID=A0A5M6DFF9_9BACT|nr:F0F1 ATP synthase subunit alpha [Roseiconus nitratireducens]KAA5546238.1 F0F1 ATP synthase subunit alpha [Roseiconus nitratireducens]